jgi:putative IMPACT (imprinted ancient) family translation regulator
LGQIQSKGLTNILIVVVRYFGGTLLGVGGLITAYRAAAAEAIAGAEIVEEQILFAYTLSFGYERMNEVMRVLKQHHCKILAQDQEIHETETKSKISIAVRKSLSENTENALKKINGIILTFTGVK